ncbi:MAG: arsenite methyltransferase [Bacteroidales bacterium]|nr:arsenite methyltransferase [Bacteroidales bacterium]MCF8398423.1 arsenite methyltransferase [Bacteroidales bacterium]
MKFEKDDLKEVVRTRYNQIAQQSKEKNETSCCGSTDCCGEVDYTIFSDDYSELQGYNTDADLGLGCGLPTEHAGLKKGDTVIDLGSGAGNDCFVARSIVGEEGMVWGLDFAGAMLTKARKNTKKLGLKNISFVKGDIESMPFENELADVIISNCVLNLVPDKNKAFSEIFRVLKTLGHFCVSDVVLEGKLPENIRKATEMYAGCVSGALQKDEYLETIRGNGFTGIEIKKEKKINVPDELLLQYISREELKTFRENKSGIFSITVTANKA